MSADSIIYCDFDSPLGEMIAGATSRGVCFLEWHDRGGVERIRERVRKRYRVPLVSGTNRWLELLRDESSQYFAGDLKVFSVSPDVTGTPFELRTWEQLRKIPYGVTRTYGQIATALGMPSASRAVGRANGANYLSILIPCHRVIESSGGLRGFGGKLWRKKYLLELEAGLRPEIDRSRVDRAGQP